MLRRYRLNFQTAELELELVDGTQFSSTFPGNPFGDDERVQGISVDLVDRELQIAMSSGLSIEVELGSSATDAPAAGRPVIYLDQLHWITLARQLWSPKKVGSLDREPASKLITLAR